MPGQSTPNLTVHKNTRDQRKRKAMAADLVPGAKEIARHTHVAGFAIVAWDKHFMHSVIYQTGGTLPGFALPGYAQGVLQKVCFHSYGDEPKDE